MRVDTYVLEMTGDAQNLNTVLTFVNADVDIRHLSFTPGPANTNPIYVGKDNTVDAATFGWYLPASTAGIPSAPMQFENLRVALMRFWVKGTAGEKLHLGIIIH